MEKKLGASVPQEVVDALYELRRTLCLLASRIGDEAYSQESNRVCVAIDLGFAASDVDWVMFELGLPSWGDYDFSNADQLAEQMELASLRTRDKAGRR